MTLSQKQQDEILSLCRSLVPTIEWAPKECWLEDGESEKTERPFHFLPQCSCGDRESVEPPLLTLFLKCGIVGQGRNLVGRMQGLVRKYLEGFVGLGCANCEGRVEVDIRLFPRGLEETRAPEEVYQEGYRLVGGNFLQ